MSPAKELVCARRQSSGFVTAIMFAGAACFCRRRSIGATKTIKKKKFYSKPASRVWSNDIKLLSPAATASCGVKLQSMTWRCRRLTLSRQGRTLHFCSSKCIYPVKLAVLLSSSESFGVKTRSVQDNIFITGDQGLVSALNRPDIRG